MLAPQNVAGVRRLLGMSIYFEKSSDALSGMSKPLRQQTSDKVALRMQCSHEQKEASPKMKVALCSTPHRYLTFFR